MGPRDPARFDPARAWLGPCDLRQLRTVCWASVRYVTG